MFNFSNELNKLVSLIVEKVHVKIKYFPVIILEKISARARKYSRKYRHPSSSWPLSTIFPVNFLYFREFLLSPCRVYIHTTGSGILRLK
tara:strand:- start:104 stop:370 length:267 start_codon:yes stop_codon:yes gene_type:complete